MSSSDVDQIDLQQTIADLFTRFDELDELSKRLSDESVQQLFTIAVKLYAAKLDDEVVLFPFASEDVLTATDVGMTVGHMIKAADIDLFELVAWQSLRGN